MQLKGWLNLFFLACGIVATYVLIKEYKNYGVSNVKVDIKTAQPFSIVGPISGRVKYLDIIKSPVRGCLDNGFMIFFDGIDGEDFVVLTDSVRASFGDISGNIVGMSFKFERLAECRANINNLHVYMLVESPVIIDNDSKDREKN